MVAKPSRVSADAVNGDLMAIAGGEKQRLDDRLAAAEARINHFKISLAELATRHGWPQPKLDQFTDHLGQWLEKALASERLNPDQVVIFQRALERL